MMLQSLLTLKVNCYQEAQLQISVKLAWPHEKCNKSLLSSTGFKVMVTACVGFECVYEFHTSTVSHETSQEV